MHNSDYYYKLSDRNNINPITLNWLGTEGVGDLMWGLNTAHQLAHVHKCMVDFRVHWKHDENYLWHFEDPETIIERFEYVRDFYLDPDLIIHNHVFNSTRDFTNSLRYSDLEFKPLPENRLNYWQFDPNVFEESIPGKIVIWRPTFNADPFVPSKLWKWEINGEQWNRVINILNKNYDVVELTYRTPIREAFYHISNCQQVIAYDGMWHYFARNIFKPMAVISGNRITHFHTPHAKMLRRDKVFNYVENLDKHTRELEIRAKRLKKQTEQWYDAHR